MTNVTEPQLPKGSIQLRNVTKEYVVIRKAAPRVGAWLLSKAFEYFRREPFIALDDVTLDIQPGEMVAFMGHNGAGKSSLLKLIAGISPPTHGTVRVQGKVASLLELGIGFHPELTGMENIFYNGAIMGLSRRQILEKLETIIRFSGLEEFLYEAVKHYSSGMYSRLGCAVALHLEPEIILMDEVLAVGDVEFQQRCLARIRTLHKQGVTIALVSHDGLTAADVASRMIWLEHGKIREDGDPKQVLEHYSKAMMERADRTGIFSQSAPLLEGFTASLDSWECHVEGKPTFSVKTGEALTLSIHGSTDAPSARLAMEWRRSDGQILMEEVSPAVAVANGKVEWSYVVNPWPFLDMEVTINLFMLHGEATHAIARQRAAFVITSEAGFPTHGFMVRPRQKWSVEKVES